MKLLTALLLSFAGTVGVSGMSVSASVGRASDRPKEPPSTTLVVQGESSISAATQAQQTSKVKSQSITPPSAVFTARYKFNEKSQRVKNLQRALGNVYVDGHYGKQTRQSHIWRLKKLGLSTTIVPSIPKPTPKYNISYDKEKRCPQYEQAFEDHGLVPVEVFSYVAWRESRCNPESVNAIWKNGKIVWTLNSDGSYDSGLLQINSSWKTATSEVCGSQYGDLKVLRNLDCNLKVAKFILDNSSNGLANWGIYRRS